jgi:hypothetical protein
MKLGMNLIGGFEEWRKWSPFTNEALKAEPLWSGDWTNRHYPEFLEPGLIYKSAISSGHLTGEHHVLVQGAQAWQLRSAIMVSDGIYRFLPQNAWIELSVSQRVPASSISIIIAAVGSELERIWKPGIEDLTKPFSKCLRVMDAMGAHSNLANADLKFSFSARALPLPETTEGWDREGGVQPWTLNIPNFESLWMSVPLLLSANPNEVIKWVSQFVGPTNPNQTIYLCVSNELWNGMFPQARELLEWARLTGVNSDPYIGRAVLALRLTKQIKDMVVRAGLSSRIKTVFEWQCANNWPFALDPWNNNLPVCQEARDLLQDIGIAAVAPYFASNVRTKGELMGSISQSFDSLRSWKRITDSLGVKLYCYEGGHELPLDVDPSIHRTPEMAQACVAYLNEINQILDQDSLFCWYGLNDPHWGVAETHLDLEHPRYLALKNWAYERGT